MRGAGALAGFAEELTRDLFGLNIAGFAVDVSCVSLHEYDQDNLELETVVLFLLPTYEGGVPPANGRVFCEWLADMVLDFRVSRTWLKNTTFAVFGLGNSDYDENHCEAARQLHRGLCKVGAMPLASLAKGDDSVDMIAQFRKWRDRIIPKLCEMAAARAPAAAGAAEESPAAAAGSCGSGDCGSGGTDGAPTSLKQVKSWEEQEAALRPAASAGQAAAAAKQLARDRSKLTRNQRRRLTREATRNKKMREWQEEQHARYAAISEEVHSAWESSTAGTSTGDREVLDDDGVPVTSEDIVNDHMLTLDELEARGLAIPDSDLEGIRDSTQDAAATAGAAGGHGGGGMVDLEDLAAVYAEAKAGASAEGPLVDPLTKPDMVTPKQFKALTKEGYNIIGTHSAVKLCRWTKHQLRGRGGCYKHSCYGITSYQCMETTPSLACANKCVFCWRHMKNPTGREWRWKLDEPEMIVEEAIAKHVAMIKMMRGVPGIKMDRWLAAFTVKHCALSLVGEPIMYPHIGRFVDLLHERGISSFLVTNCQFPEAISTLPPVTQLYVSVDASTKDALKAVDRPLFKDFWERFLGSLDALRAKRQRTVYRMTLVKRYNMDAVEGYVNLVTRGSPDFIEVKAVTYCGESNASDLTIKDVPWHEEVREFCAAMVQRLREQGEDYGLACEHEHSNLVLIAKRKFWNAEEGRWWTWIDYPKFHELAAKARASDGAFTFGAEDYMAPTPAWAHYDAPEAGFSPNEVRFKRTKGGGGYRPLHEIEAEAKAKAEAEAEKTAEG